MPLWNIHTHTHSFVMELSLWQHSNSCQHSVLFCATAKRPPLLPGLLFHSLFSHPLRSSLCFSSPSLWLLAPSSFHLDHPAATVFFQFCFAFPSLVSLFLPYSPSTSLLPLSVFSPLRIFFFHHFFGFISACSLHLITPLSFPQMSLCYKYLIWLKSTFLCITHAHIHFWYLFFSQLISTLFLPHLTISLTLFKKQFHPFCLTKCLTKCAYITCFTSSFLEDGLFRVFEETEAWFNITKFSSSHCAR